MSKDGVKSIFQQKEGSILQVERRYSDMGDSGGSKGNLALLAAKSWSR